MNDHQHQPPAETETTPQPAGHEPAADRFAPLGNAWIAQQLRRAAGLLAAQGANPFRTTAYRRAADAIARMPTALRDVLNVGGHPALEAIPGVGPSIAAAIAEMLSTGRWRFLEHLKGVADPETLFCAVPGIGPGLAHQIQERLHLDSLEALEAAAHDGRLAAVPGFGDRRVAMVRTSLAEMLARVRPPMPPVTEEPDVGMLLDVNREYRDLAAAGTLPRIAPKRFNPAGEAWLPVLHTVRAPWHFTALYSNTARAHQLGRTGDWVVVYFHRDARAEGRRTIVSEPQGASRGRRMVRGREAECRAWYESLAPGPEAPAGAPGFSGGGSLMRPPRLG